MCGASARGPAALSRRFFTLALAPRLPFIPATPMVRITALVAVLALAGTPAVALACDLWCVTPLAAAHHQRDGCHTGSNDVTSPRVVLADGECHLAVTEPPFVAAARNEASDRIDVTTFAGIATLPPRIPLRVAGTRARVVPAPQGTRPTVLRI